jgi:hypothetical protein
MGQIIQKPVLQPNKPTLRFFVSLAVDQRMKTTDILIFHREREREGRRGGEIE